MSRTKQPRLPFPHEFIAQHSPTENEERRRRSEQMHEELLERAMISREECNEERRKHLRVAPDFDAMNRSQLEQWADENISDCTALMIAHDTNNSDTDLRLILEEIYNNGIPGIPADTSDEMPLVESARSAEQIREELLERARISREESNKSLTQKITEELIGSFNEEYSYQQPYDDGSKSLDQINVVKAYHGAANKLIAYLEEDHKSELNYSKENIFPRAWMINDVRVMKVIEKYPYLIPLLNFLFNKNRRIKGDEYKALKEWNRQNLGDRFTHISTYVADRDFYREASSHLGVSESLIKKYLHALKYLDMIPAVRVGRYNVIHDGRFIETPTGPRKISHITHERIDNLRKFSVDFHPKH